MRGEGANKASCTKIKVADLCTSACILAVWLSLNITLFIVYTVNNSQAPACFEKPLWDGESSTRVCGGKSEGERKKQNGRKRRQRKLKRKRDCSEENGEKLEEKAPLSPV